MIDSNNAQMQIASTCRRSSVRCNLNESFDTSLSNANYSIIDYSTSPMKVRLRKSQKRKQIIIKSSTDSSSDDLNYSADFSNDSDESLSQKDISVLEESIKNISVEGLAHSKVILTQLNTSTLTPSLNKKDLHVILERSNMENILDKHKISSDNSSTDDETAPATPKKRRDVRNVITNFQQNSDLRRSSRNVDKKSYVEISPDQLYKRNRTPSVRNNSLRTKSLKFSEDSTPTSRSLSTIKNNVENLKSDSHKKLANNKRNTIKSKHYDSENESSPTKRHRKLTNNEDDLTLYDTKDTNITKFSTPIENAEFQTPKKTRPQRNSTIPSRYRESIEHSTPSKLNCNNSHYFMNNDSPTKENLPNNYNLKFSKTPSAYKKDITDDNEEDLYEYTNTPHKTQNPKTPKSVVRNTPSQKAKLIREGIITPTVQIRATPIRGDMTPLNKARTKLHVSFIPEALPCREKEYNDIYTFLEGKLLDGCGGCMYVSGVPGTGKTATVTAVTKKLQIRSDKHILPDFVFVHLNGMRLTEPRQSYVEILRQLTGKTVPWEQAQSILDSQFTKSRKKSKPIILLVDELDILCTKRQDVVYNLLDWPTKASAQLIVITIANTMDLPERLLMGRVTSRLGLTRLTFQAYTHKQLQEIVTRRLMGTDAFNPDAVQLVARKVASVSGDARRALDICRMAAEIAEEEGPNALVSMKHVNEALNAMITQPKVRAIKHCSRLQQLILRAIVAEVERTGVEETTFCDIFTMFESVAAIDGFKKISSTLALAAVSKLGACRLLLTEQKSNDYHQKLILNVSPDDVYYALRKD